MVVNPQTIDGHIIVGGGAVVDGDGEGVGRDEGHPLAPAAHVVAAVAAHAHTVGSLGHEVFEVVRAVFLGREEFGFFVTMLQLNLPGVAKVVAPVYGGNAAVARSECYCNIVGCVAGHVGAEGKPRAPFALTFVAAKGAHSNHICTVGLKPLDGVDGVRNLLVGGTVSGVACGCITELPAAGNFVVPFHSDKREVLFVKLNSQVGGSHAGRGSGEGQHAAVVALIIATDAFHAHIVGGVLLKSKGVGGLSSLNLFPVIIAGLLVFHHVDIGLGGVPADGGLEGMHLAGGQTGDGSTCRRLALHDADVVLRTTCIYSVSARVARVKVGVVIVDVDGLTCGIVGLERNAVGPAAGVVVDNNYHIAQTVIVERSGEGDFLPGVGGEGYAAAEHLVGFSDGQEGGQGVRFGAHHIDI